MSPMDALRDAIDPALAELPERMASDAARVMLVAIGLQESRLTDRVQRNGGPARGLWQFERYGGCLGVLARRTTAQHAQVLCGKHDVRPTASEVWAALAQDDVLAAGFARLLLWTDPLPLPDDMDAGWSYYLRNWRPGRPHPQTWPAFYRRAVQAVQEQRKPAGDAGGAA